MALYMIGIGLNDEKDISVKALEVVRGCSSVYLEHYTSILSVGVDKLESFYGKKVILADRELVEKRADVILSKAKDSDVAFLVVGDVFSATTHVDLMQRAKKEGVSVNVIHNASVLTAVGVVGLELYKYGRVASIPFHNENVKSPVDVYLGNQKIGLHTLFLLDLDPLNDKFMSVSEAASYLLKNGVKDVMAVGVAQLGSSNPYIKYAKLSELENLNLGRYPQCLIIPGKLHFVEEEVLSII